MKRMVYQKITATGGGQFQVPAGVYFLFLIGCGGGGAGASGQSILATPFGGCGGGGSGVSTRMVRVIPGEIYNYFVGAGGVAGGNFDSGGDGQPTSFGGEIFLGGGGASNPQNFGLAVTNGYKPGVGNNNGGRGNSTSQANRSFQSVTSAIPDGGMPGTSGGSYLGGGGGGAGAGPGASGGNGVASGSSANAPSGAANTGAGGGGSGGAPSMPGSGGNGGSGFLIIGWFS